METRYVAVCQCSCVVTPFIFQGRAGILNCRYLEDEHNEKLRLPFDATCWDITSGVLGVPPQLNNKDCGVFTCMFLDYLSTNGKVRVVS